MISTPVTAIDVTPQSLSLRWCRLSFSVTTARSPVPQAAGAGLGWSWAVTGLVSSRSAAPQWSQ